jgi:predicted RNA-binding Zn ribbon-like protein
MNMQEYMKQGFGQPAVWIDFVNSFENDGLGNSADHLRNPAWLRSFMRHWNFVAPARQHVPFAALTRLRALLRAGADRLSSSHPVRPRELQKLNAAMGVWTYRQLVHQQNGFVLRDVPRRKDWRWIQAQIAASFAKTLAKEPLQRVKICPDPRCRWVFYDKTKGKTRLWCNARTCGNRNRVRRARAANKAGNGRLP